MFKFIIVGDTCKKLFTIYFLDVGKSNMLTQYTQNKFRGEHEITIGCEFMAKNILIENKHIRIQVWDTAGQEAFRSITRSYYKNSACAILTYDITNRDSFNNIASWLKDSRELSPTASLMVLVGNKCDLEENRQVTYSEAEEFAKINDMFFVECSAKTGYNIDSIFSFSAKEIVNRIESGNFEIKDETCGVKLGINSRKGIISKIFDGDNKNRRCCKTN